jgi:ribonuclease P protein component
MRSQAGAGFNRAMRLADKSVFGVLLRSRERTQSGPLMLQMLPGDSEQRPEQGRGLTGDGRLGMAVAKRHAKKAVDRNLLKRLLREAYRQHGLSHRPIDLVVSLRSSWAGGTSSSARKALRGHIARIFDQAERKSSQS